MLNNQELQSIQYFLNLATLKGQEAMALAQLQVKISQELQPKQDNKVIGNTKKEEKDDKK